MHSQALILLCLLVLVTAVLCNSEAHRLSPDGVNKRAYHFFRIRRANTDECITIPDYVKDALQNPASLCPEDRMSLFAGL